MSKMDVTVILNGGQIEKFYGVDECRQVGGMDILSVRYGKMMVAFPIHAIQSVWCEDLESEEDGA